VLLLLEDLLLDLEVLLQHLSLLLDLEVLSRLQEIVFLVLRLERGEEGVLGEEVGVLVRGGVQEEAAGGGVQDVAEVPVVAEVRVRARGLGLPKNRRMGVAVGMVVVGVVVGVGVVEGVGVVDDVVRVGLPEDLLHGGVVPEQLVLQHVVLGDVLNCNKY